MLSRYQTSITLTEEEKDLVEALKLRDIGTIDIFRVGLCTLCPDVSIELLDKIKGLVTK